MEFLREIGGLPENEHVIYFYVKMEVTPFSGDISFIKKQLKTLWDLYHRPKARIELAGIHDFEPGTFIRCYSSHHDLDVQLLIINIMPFLKNLENNKKVMLSERKNGRNKVIKITPKRRLDCTLFFSG